jgi:hypothetical protein
MVDTGDLMSKLFSLVLPFNLCLMLLLFLFCLPHLGLLLDPHL